MFKVLQRFKIKSPKTFNFVTTIDKLQSIFDNIDKIPIDYWTPYNFRNTIWFYRVVLSRRTIKNDDWFKDEGVLGKQPFLPKSVRQRFGITRAGKLIFELVVSPYRNDFNRFQPLNLDGELGEQETISLEKFRSNPQVQFFFPSFQDQTGMWALLRDLYILTNPDVTIQEAFKINNLEVRREALKHFPIDMILHDKASRIIEQTKEGILFEFGWNHYLWVKDATTPREYILAIPKVWEPDWVMKQSFPITKVHVARAYTFGIHPTAFNPKIET